MEPITREQWKAAFASVNHLRGAKLVINAVRQFVEEQELPQGNSAIVPGAQILQQVLDYLAARNGARCSYNSRLRYRRILQTISNSLFQSRIISQPLLLEISPQYEREQVARIPALGQYQISGYFRFLTCLQKELAGFGKTLIPKGFHDEVYCWLAVILAAWGICGSKPVSRLVLLEWGDVLFPPDHPVRWPNNQRHGYRWVYLPPICRLSFYCLLRQRRHGTSSPRIFPQDSKKLARSVRRFLAEKCKAYNLPVLTLEMVGQLSRFEMLQDMSNHEVSVLSGRIRFSPLPADQVADVLNDRRISIDPTRYSLVPSVSINSQTIHPSEIGSPENPDVLLQAYDRYLSEVRPLLLDLWQASSPRTNAQPLLEWIDKNMEEITDVAKFNVVWLLRWQLHLSGRKSFRLSSCHTYWIAALRVLHQFPGLRISDIGREELVSVFNEISDGDGDGSHYRHTTRRLSRAAWQSLFHFLQGENLALPTMDWKSIRIQREYLPVRKITDENVRRLLEYLEGSPEQSLIWLARRAGLRVSEACNLWVEDVCLSSPAYLVIFKSKRQKDRKVDLSKMTERELAFLSSLVNRARSASSQYLFFDTENKPFNPHKISKSTIHAFQKLGLRKNDKPGQEVSFHGLRSSAASFFQAEKKDIRYTALQLGHSWVTTTEGYLHDADLSANTAMQSRSNPWNTPQMCIPLSTIAFLLGVTDRRMAQIIGLPGGKAAASLFEEGKLFRENPPLDGPRPKRRGKTPYLINVTAAAHILDHPIPFS